MNEVSTWKLPAWFHSPRTNCFLSPFIESDLSLKSSSLGNDSEKNCDLHECFWVRSWVFFETSHLLYRYRIPGRDYRCKKASTCFEMCWYVMVATEFWNLNGYTSPPTATLRVSARRPSRSGFPLADRRDPGFRSPTAAILVSTRRRPAKGQLWEPNQTRSMVQRIFWSSLQEFDLVHPGSLGKLSADQTPAKLVFKFAVMLLTYPSNGSQQDWPQHCISNYSYQTDHFAISRMFILE